MQKINGFQSLSTQDMIQTNGGGNLIYDIFYVAGATLRCLREFTKAAAEYQASLPPNLKK